MSIIIVDDSKVNRLLLRRILEDRGLKDLFEAADVMELFTLIGFAGAGAKPPACRKIDLILMDIMMPEIDGIEACQQLHQSPVFRDVPIIMVTAAGEGELLEKAFAAGAMDYLTKPIDSLELVARVKSAMALKHEMDTRKARESELLELQKQLVQTNSNLNSILQQIQKDLEVAAQMQQKMLPPQGMALNGMTTGWQLHPCSRLGGDFLNLLPLSRRHSCFFLVDVAGHGVQAALLAFSLSRMLSNSSTGEGNLLIRRDGTAYPPSEVLGRLNRRFCEEEQLDQYFTIVYGLFDAQEKTVTLSRGGHPPAILLSSATSALSFFKEGGPPIGMVAEIEFSEFQLPVSSGDRLYLYSDGITETQEQESQAMLGETGLSRILVQHQSSPLPVTLEKVIKACEIFRGEKEQADDMSILGIQFQ